MSHDYLPQLARELIDLIGWDDAIALMQRWGGTYVDVPMNPERANKLAQVISPAGLEKLCAYYSGGRIEYVPKLDKLLQHQRNAGIKKDMQTMSARDVALKYNVTRQWAYIVAGKPDTDSPQIPLL